MQTTRAPRSVLIAFALIALLAAACAADEPVLVEDSTIDGAEHMDGDEQMDEAGHEEFAFGEPASADEADRVIEITAKDIEYEPASIEIVAGETVTFRVTNSGAIPHDFTLGTDAMQDEHEAEMAEMGGDMMHDEANAFAIAPGETKETTWHFTEPGELLIGCHQPGHYAAGMRITVTVAA